MEDRRWSADDLLWRLGIETPEDIDLEAISHFCQATIVYEPLNGCAARIVGHGNQAIITIDSKAREGRRRFSAGHELGHWMRDRGKISFACTELMLKAEWSASNPERRANEFSADLLLPRKMFSADAQGRDINFQTVRELRERYRTSGTATAIRLVKFGSFPCMIVCSRRGERYKWFKRSPDLPKQVWPTQRPGHDTVAHDLLQGSLQNPGPTDVAADGWIDLENSASYSVREDSVPLADGLALSLLWWHDESQLLDMENS